MPKSSFSPMNIAVVLLVSCTMVQTTLAQILEENQLIQLSYDKLRVLEDSLYNQDDLDAHKIVTDAHLLKAKTLKDTAQIIDAYYEMYWGNEQEARMVIIDSCIKYTDTNAGRRSSASAHYLKAEVYYYTDLPEKAINEYIRAYHIAVEIQDHEDVVDCLNAIAYLKSEYGEENEAILLQKEALKYLERHKDKVEDYEITKLISYDNTARCYLRVKEIDSTRVYTSLGMNLALKLEDEEVYRRLAVLDAQANYYDNNLIKSRDSLQKFKDYFKGSSKADIVYYIGMIQGKLKENTRKINSFEEIDEILKVHNLPLMDNVKEVYQYLLKNANTNNNDSLEKVYMNRLFHYDSLIIQTAYEVKDVTLSKFDLPAKKLMAANATRDKIRKNNFIYILLTIASFLAIFGVYGIWRNYKQRNLIKDFMSNSVEPIMTKTEVQQTSISDISPEIVNQIMTNLEQWEVSKGFLDSDVNQNSLSKNLNTNSSYLSKIINAYKAQNFSNYLKDLRITHAINEVKNNPSMINNKSTIQIAETFGFSSVDVFSRALKNKIGVTPAVFFKQIKKGNL